LALLLQVPHSAHRAFCIPGAGVKTYEVPLERWKYDIPEEKGAKIFDSVVEEVKGACCNLS